MRCASLIALARLLTVSSCSRSKAAEARQQALRHVGYWPKREVATESGNVR